VTTRRGLLALLGAGALASPLVSLAQQARVWRIGFLTPYSRKFSLGAKRLATFTRGMRELGYVEGKNYALELRAAEESYDRLPSLAAELVQLKVDVIVAAASPAIRAAKQATSTIPIVMATTGDPVGSGFVASLARPGGNVTGLSNTNLDISAKLFELLTVVAPKLSRVAVLGDPGSSTYPAMAKSIEVAAKKSNLQAVHFTARTVAELDQSFSMMTRERADAVIIAIGSFLIEQATRIAGLAVGHRLPSIAQGREYADAGGLLSYGADLSENFRRAAVYVDKILKGAKPRDLPVEQPTRLELVINRKTAKALGITIPQELLLRADEMIE
jgi:putative ABC transport system substrate-binding protein